MTDARMATWPSGKAEACKAFTPGSNPGVASNFDNRLAKAKRTYADMAQLVEHHLAKVGVAGSNPVVRSTIILQPGSSFQAVFVLRHGYAGFEPIRWNSQKKTAANPC